MQSKAGIIPGGMSLSDNHTSVRTNEDGLR